MDLNLDPQLVLIVMIVLFVFILLSLILIALLFRRFKKFKNAYVSLQTYMSKVNLEDLLQANLRELQDSKQRIEIQEKKISLMEEKLRGAVDTVGLVRFNSFANMGAELSFALALLNQQGNGILLTSIQSIEECRIYAKNIEQGKAAVKLIEEEKRALEIACAGMKKI